MNMNLLEIIHVILDDAAQRRHERSRQGRPVEQLLGLLAEALAEASNGRRRIADLDRRVAELEDDVSTFQGRAEDLAETFDRIATRLGFTGSYAWSDVEDTASQLLAWGNEMGKDKMVHLSNIAEIIGLPRDATGMQITNEIRKLWADRRAGWSIRGEGEERHADAKRQRLWDRERDRRRQYDLKLLAELDRRHANDPDPDMDDYELNVWITRAGTLNDPKDAGEKHE